MAVCDGRINTVTTRFKFTSFKIIINALLLGLKAVHIVYTYFLEAPTVVPNTIVFN